MLQAMCGRYCGVAFRQWRAVTAAFVGVLFASVQILNGEQAAAGEAAGEAGAQQQPDVERQVRLVRRLTGGIKSFLIPPEGEHATQDQPGETEAGTRRNMGKTTTVDEAKAIARIEANVVEAVVCQWAWMVAYAERRLTLYRCLGCMRHVDWLY